MSKDTFYFSHDYNTRTDSKIKRLLVVHGYTGYGIFWAIIEDLYNNANALPTDYESIAYDLRTDKATIESIVNDFQLFVVADGNFMSLSIERRLGKRNEKSAKARESALSRWGNVGKEANALKNDANALRPECDSNAIKESKVKENKVNGVNTGGEPPEQKNISFEKKQESFYNSLIPFVSTHSKEMIKAFYDYWREPNKSKTKMKFEQETTWDLNLRLQRWANNDFSKNSNTTVRKLYPADGAAPGSVRSAM
jgi:hypothetical protein